MSIKEAFVHTLWCEDIRMEVGNKPSFMGVFTAGMLLPSLPAVLQKLCMHTWVCSPVDMPIGSLAVDIVRDDGVVLASANVEPPSVSLPTLDDSTRRNAAVAMAIGPLEIPEGCKWFMARAKFNGNVVDGPKLRIEVDANRFAAVTGIPAPPVAESLPSAG